MQNVYTEKYKTVLRGMKEDWAGNHTMFKGEYLILLRCHFFTVDLETQHYLIQIPEV
jgi:hypothetical protein